MKKLFFALGCIPTLLFAQQPSLVWSTPIIANTNNTYGSTRPRIVLTNNDVPLVVWGTATSGSDKVYASRWNGNAFATPIQISPSVLNVYTSSGEGGDVAANNDTVFAVFFALPGKVYAVKSTDGGITWADTVRVDHQTSDDALTPAITFSNNIPHVAFETNDNPLLNPKQYYTYSTDGGLTWANEIQASGAAAGVPCECCPPTILAADSQVFVIYRNNDNNRRNIFVASSMDYGQSFPTATEIDQTNWLINSCPTAGPASMFWNDSVVTVWKSQSKVYAGTMNRLTGQSAPHRLLDPLYSGNALMRFPHIAGQNDTLAYAWTDNRVGNSDCYVRFSVNGLNAMGQNWLINDSSTMTQNSSQISPHIAYRNGVFHFVWQENVTGLVFYRTATLNGWLSIDEAQQNMSTLVLMPNPTLGTTRLQSSKTAVADLQVFNVQGQCVLLENAFESGSELNTEDLPAGVYWIRFGSETVKLFVQ
ncbi:MAG: T9SS type A sorting domain-containing protein [Bacteroidia bacterium]